MTTIDFLWAVPVFGLLIFIHELGHFAVAKAYGIKVHEFALGFGPALVGFTRGETRYNWRLFPLGGFVRMAGMEESEAHEPDGFNRKPLLARALVIFAGPVMNFVLAALLYAGFLFFIGADQLDQPILGDVQQSCATVDGLESGVQQPCPAHLADLQEGDRIRGINGSPVKEWQDIYDLVAASEGEPLHIQLERDGELSEVTVEPIQVEGRWVVGIRPATKREPLGTALVQGTIWTVQISGAWLQGIFAIITGQIEPDVMGPVGITVAIAEYAAHSMQMLIWLTALLSINLGLVNLLPIPALDGSRLVFLGLEWVRGRRIDPQRENLVHFVGFVLLIGLMLVITYSDIFNR